MTLSSFRCDFEDTAQYRVSAMNTQGEQSAIASVVVKSRLFSLTASHSHVQESLLPIKKLCKAMLLVKSCL